MMTNASENSLKRAWTLCLPSQRQKALALAKCLSEEGSASISITAVRTPAGGLGVITLTFKTLVDAPSYDALFARLTAMSSPRLTSLKESVESLTGSRGNPTLSRDLQKEMIHTYRWPASYMGKP